MTGHSGSSRDARPTRRVRSALAATAAVGAMAIGLTGCADGAPATTASGDDLSGSLTVYAAASLTASFTELLDAFAAEHPAVTVAPPAFDGSSTLATQLREGAPADVFASADQANMQTVAQLVENPVVFTTNTLEIAVAPGNPRGIHSLADLARPDLDVIVCAPRVPCGSATRELLRVGGVDLTPASEEQNVTAVLRKVELGEADAGVVYVTDVAAAAGRVDGVRLPDASQAVNDYPIAVLRDAQNPRVARAFVAFVLSEQGRGILQRYGFGAP